MNGPYIADKVRTLYFTSPPVAVRVAAEAVRFALQLLQQNAKQLWNVVALAERWARQPTASNQDAVRRASVGISNINDLRRDHEVVTGLKRDLRVDYAVNAVWHLGLAVTEKNRDRGWAAGLAVDDVVWAAGLAVDDVVRAAEAHAPYERVVRDHLHTHGWFTDYDWTRILMLHRVTVLAPQFPYVRGPFRIIVREMDTCWTLDELRQLHRTRPTRLRSDILVAVDAASEGVMLDI